MFKKPVAWMKVAGFCCEGGTLLFMMRVKIFFITPKALTINIQNKP
jgi:hypothetical protein